MAADASAYAPSRVDSSLPEEPINFLTPDQFKALDSLATRSGDPGIVRVLSDPEVRLIQLLSSTGLALLPDMTRALLSVRNPEEADEQEVWRRIMGLANAVRRAVFENQPLPEDFPRLLLPSPTASNADALRGTRAALGSSFDVRFRNIGILCKRGAGDEEVVRIRDWLFDGLRDILKIEPRIDCGVRQDYDDPLNVALLEEGGQRLFLP